MGWAVPCQNVMSTQTTPMGNVSVKDNSLSMKNVARDFCAETTSQILTYMTAVSRNVLRARFCSLILTTIHGAVWTRALNQPALAPSIWSALRMISVMGSMLTCVIVMDSFLSLEIASRHSNAGDVKKI